MHRALQTQQLSARKARPKPRDVLDRYQADFPNEIWQSDMLQGPWLPDPRKPRKMRKSWLYPFSGSRVGADIDRRLISREVGLVLTPG